MSDSRAEHLVKNYIYNDKPARALIREFAETPTEAIDQLESHIETTGTFFAFAHVARECALPIAEAGVLTTAAAIFLPIETFRFGKKIREDLDEIDEETDAMRAVILSLAIKDAIDTHLNMNRDSKLLDDKAPHRISFTHMNDISLKHISAMWSSTLKRWRDRLDDELGLQRVMREAGGSSQWRAYVLSSFDQISSEFRGILDQAERNSWRSRGFGRQPRALSAAEERRFGL
jgi:hypothetical protein